jgi:tRNA (mo5U34)-methyltransferase
MKLRSPFSGQKKNGQTQVATAAPGRVAWRMPERSVAEEAEIEKDAARYQWYHRIQLTSRYTTPGICGWGRDSDFEKKYLFPGAPELAGKSLLDIGAMNGFFAFEAERRGAYPVTAIDRDPPGFPDAREAFGFAAKTLNSSARYFARSVYDLEPSDSGTFDYVLMYGVLYHLKFPLYGLYRAASVCKEVFLLETHVTLRDDLKWPIMLFYPGSELNDEPTNWWGPNIRCVDAMMEHLGFQIEKRYEHDQNVSGLAPARYTVRCRRVGPTPPPFSDL